VKTTAQQIKDYFMLTGDTDKNIADKFQVSIKTVKLLTQDALIQYQHAKAQSKALWTSND
jgi:transposase